MFNKYIQRNASFILLFPTRVWVYWNTFVSLYVHPSHYLVYATTHLSFGGFCSYLVCWLGMMRGCAYYTDFMVGGFLQSCGPFWWKSILHLVPICVHNYSFIFWWILFIFGMFVGHDARMCTLYWFYGWLVFVGVMALYDENSFYFVHACVHNYSFILWQILFIYGMLVGLDVRIHILYRFHFFCWFLPELLCFMIKNHFASCLRLCAQLLIYLLCILYLFHGWLIFDSNGPIRRKLENKTGISHIHPVGGSGSKWGIFSTTMHAVSFFMFHMLIIFVFQKEI